MAEKITGKVWTLKTAIDAAKESGAEFDPKFPKIIRIKGNLSLTSCGAIDYLVGIHKYSWVKVK